MANGSAPNLAAAATEVDKLEVFVLMDNVSDVISSVPDNVVLETGNLMKAGMREFHGSCLCCASFGLSLVITAYSGNHKHTLLFDGGPDGAFIERNGKNLNIPFGDVEHIMLSHGHFDHAGGLMTALQLVQEHNKGKEVHFHVNDGMFNKRGIELPTGDVLPLADVPSVDEIAAQGAIVVNDGDAQLLLKDMFYLSGEIPRITKFEPGLPGHLCRKGEDGEWEPDPWIMDERFLAIKIRGKGVLVFTACSHAGVVNVLSHAEEVFSPGSLYGVMGGFHLSGGLMEPRIPETVEALAAFNLKMIVPGHCTGWRATHALLNKFGEGIVIPSAVGRLHTFQ